MTQYKSGLLICMATAFAATGAAVLLNGEQAILLITPAMFLPFWLLLIAALALLARMAKRQLTKTMLNYSAFGCLGLLLPSTLLLTLLAMRN